MSAAPLRRKKMDRRSDWILSIGCSIALFLHVYGSGFNYGWFVVALFITSAGALSAMGVFLRVLDRWEYHPLLVLLIFTIFAIALNLVLVSLNDMALAARELLWKIYRFVEYVFVAINAALLYWWCAVCGWGALRLLKIRGAVGFAGGAVVLLSLVWVFLIGGFSHIKKAVYLIF